MTEPGARVPAARRLLQIAAIVLVVAAVAWVVRGIPLAEIAGALRRLTVGEIVVLLCVNIGITYVFTLRWWIILRAQGHRIPLIRLSTYRLAGFALSYLTPGTQFGGEPLQIALCHRRHAVPTPDATAAVIIDRAVELLGNFTFLAFGLVLSLRLRLIPDEGGRWLGFVAAALLFIPLSFLAAALTGRKPLTGALALGADTGDPRVDRLGPPRGLGGGDRRADHRLLPGTARGAGRRNGPLAPWLVGDRLRVRIDAVVPGCPP